MKISEVAARSGVPASTLRYYERLDLLAPGRSVNGYRAFDESHLERLEFIDAAKQLGLELPEIRRLLALADTGTCTGVKATLLPLLAEQIAVVDHQLETLARLSSQLRTAQDHVDACPDSDQRCRSECAFRMLVGGSAPASDADPRGEDASRAPTGAPPPGPPARPGGARQPRSAHGSHWHGERDSVVG